MRYGLAFMVRVSRGDLVDGFASAVASCERCEAPRKVRAESRLVGSTAPLWLRSAFRRMQLEQGGSTAVTKTEIAERLRLLREADPSLSVEGLAVVCCYFNPCGFRSRATNYLRFAQALERSGVKLLTVELAIGEAQHELPEVYGEIHRVRANAVLWHKERLLNIGIDRLLAEGYQQIAWLDADIEFVATEDWAWFVAAALKDAPLCQVFSNLVADTGLRPVPAMSALKYFELSGEALDQATRAPSRRRPLGLPMGMPGYGWAARADLLRDCKLYDRAIVGGGDKLIFAATVLGEERARQVEQFVESPFENCALCGHSTSVSESLVEDLAGWSRQWYEGVGGSASVADLALKVMFHGSWSKRSYWLRQELLAKYSFDPDTDLSQNEDGCWEWASDKPDLHRQVACYFQSRDEDSP